MRATAAAVGPAAARRRASGAHTVRATAAAVGPGEGEGEGQNAILDEYLRYQDKENIR